MKLHNWTKPYYDISHISTKKYHGTIIDYKEFVIAKVTRGNTPRFEPDAENKFKNITAAKKWVENYFK